MQDQDTYARAPAYSGAPGSDDTRSSAAVAAETATETAKGAARDVAGTAKEQAGAVVGEARGQMRRLASQARDQATDRVRGGHNQMVDRLRGLADEFAEMGGDGDSPGKALVGDLGQRGQRVADYLADRGPEGLVSELTDIARRRPFVFLAGAVAAGFLVGRLGKNVWKAQQDGSGPTYPDTAPETTPTPYADTVRLSDAQTAGYTVPPTTSAGTAAPVTPAVPPQTYPDPRQTSSDPRPGGPL